MSNPDDIEVRNPRYAGASIGDLVRALVRPKQKKATKKEQPGPPAEQASRILFQRGSPSKGGGSPES